MVVKSTLLLLTLELLEISFGMIKHHSFENESKNWMAAQGYCKDKNKDLSTFTDKMEENRFFLDAGNLTSNVWIGLSKDGIWRWTEEETAVRINWDKSKNQPNGGDEKCGLLYKDSRKVHDEDCSVNLPFFCMERSKLEVVPKSVQWAGALKFCRDGYYDLAILSTKKIIDLAYSSYLEQAEGEYVWVGLRFLAGKWRWLSGDDVDDTMLSEEEPSVCPASSVRCGALNKQAKTWKPMDCDTQLNFICQ